ncbi:MAG: OmpA family protein [Lewinellaceae bacterium]|nr:OmpA family protein [Lewinellaceae bacterium]
MRKLLQSIAILFVATLFFTACVPQKQYTDVLQEKERLERQVSFQDSLNQTAYGTSTDEAYSSQNDLAKAYRELEQLRATNRGLNQSYQELLQRYSAVVGQNRDIINAAGPGTPQTDLEAQRQASADQEAYLKAWEERLRQRESQLNYAAGNYDADVKMLDQQISQLQQELYARDQQLARLQANVNTSLGTTNPDFSVRNVGDRVQVSVNEQVLFRLGSSSLEGAGKTALRNLASALRQDPNLDILVEGHTDNTGNDAKNWELSMNRALAVVQELITAGVDPSRLSAAGRGSHDPVANNNTADGRGRNRRTEIFLIPRKATGSGGVDANNYRN